MSGFAGFDSWAALTSAISSRAGDPSQLFNDGGNGSFSFQSPNGTPITSTYQPNYGPSTGDGTGPITGYSLANTMAGGKNDAQNSYLGQGADGGITSAMQFSPDKQGIVGGLLTNPGFLLAAGPLAAGALAGGFSGVGAAGGAGGAGGLGGAIDISGQAIGNAPGIFDGSFLNVGADVAGSSAPEGFAALPSGGMGATGEFAGYGGAAGSSVAGGASGALGSGFAGTGAADIGASMGLGAGGALSGSNGLGALGNGASWTGAGSNGQGAMNNFGQTATDPFSSLLQNGLGKLGGIAANGLVNAFGNKGPGTSGGSQSAYIPTNQAGQDANFNAQYQAYQNALSGYQNKVQPQMDANYQNQINNPQNAAYMASAQNAGNMYGAAAGQANQNAAGIQQAGQANYDQSRGNASNLFGAGDAAYQAGLDPRKAMYNQNVGDLTENIRAGEYARGIQMSPQGASVEANALGRFQNDWQNQQLQRQVQGADAMSGLYGQGSSIANNGLSGLGRSMGQGTAFQQQGAQFAGLQGSTPYDAQNQIFGQQQGAIGNYFSGVQPFLQGSNQLQGNSLNYMGKGQSAQGQAFNQNQTSMQNQNNTAQQLAPLFSGGLNGMGLNGIGNWFSGFGQSGNTPTTPQY